jgi:hypothetical protein
MPAPAPSRESNPFSSGANRSSFFGPGHFWNVASVAVDSPSLPSAVHPKLEVGPVDNPLEREADAAADRVMRMPDSAASSPALTDSSNWSVRRKCACGAGAARECGAGPAHASSGVEEVLRSPGQALDAGTRAFFEPRFGRDFSQVRVHADADAVQTSQALSAHAYTVGNDLVFNSGRYAPQTEQGRALIAHELAHVAQQQAAAPLVQRKCDPDLGTPTEACTPSTASVIGWELRFVQNCDDLLAGELANIDKLKPGSRVNVHGYSNLEPTDVACHRANTIAALLRDKRADCPVAGVFQHGNTPGLRSVILEEIKPSLSWEETWLDPSTLVFTGNALYRRAAKDPTAPNLSAIAARRSQLKKWITEDVQKTLGDPKASFHQKTLDEYRRLLSSAEDLWKQTDQLLALHKHADAANDTFESWAKLTGTDQDVKGPSRAASNVPKGAKYHIDLFGEGRYAGAINIGDTARKTTTGVSGSRVPNLLFRHFSSKDLHVPIADHVADLVTSENGPVRMQAMADEIARIIAPGGIIILYNPISEEPYHDAIAKAAGGSVKKDYRSNGVKTVQTTITIPAKDPAP